MPRRLGFLLVLLSLLALLRPSYAEDREGIAIKGSSSGWVDVFVHRLVDVREDQIVVRGGRYAGFYLVPDTATRNPMGALAVPSVGAGGDSGGRLVRLGADYQVAPGAYRLYLIAEGYTEVFIPIPGERFVEVRPRHAASTRLQPLSFVVSGDSADERRMRLAPRRASVMAAIQQVSSTGLTGVDYIATCLVPASMECRRSPVPTVRPPGLVARSSSATSVKPGSYDAAFRVERGFGMHADTAVNAAVFSLAL